jgi:dipeptidyl aminopeptidase/acylaminoacyl peptidase
VTKIGGAQRENIRCQGELVEPLSTTGGVLTKEICMRTALTAVLLTGIVFLGAARPPVLSDMRDLVGVSDVQISPDGTRIAFVETIADYEHDRWNRTLDLVRQSGGSPQVITAVMHSLSSPRWAPAGDRIAYVSDDAKKKSQIFVIAASGGTPRQITRSQTGIEQYAWSPDGSRFAFVAEDLPAVKDALWPVHDDGYLDADRPQPSHLWLIPSSGGAAQRLTHGSWSVLEAAPPFVGSASDPSWSADGKTIAFTMQANADDSDSDRTSVATVDVASGRVTHLTPKTSYEYQPEYAPAGNALAYIYPHGPGPVSVMNVHLVQSGRDEDATAWLDRDVTRMAWLSGERFVMFLSDGVVTSMYEQNAGSSSAQRLHLGTLVPTEMSVSENGTIAIVASSWNKPSEVYVIASGSTSPRQLTDLNARVASMQFGKSEEVRWSAPDGEQSDGVLTYPAGYLAGKKYPLVLRIHGGPESFTSLGFDQLRQLLAARGYLVFQPNYRGSDNLGNEHEHAIYRDPGVGPGRDVAAGIVSLVRRGIVDPSRECVTGHSYGGYMTAWLIGHWHNWRCAVVGDGMVDWKEEYDLSAAGNLAWTRDSLGGSPWDPRTASLYVSGSPISYAGEMDTPTRIISGTADETVPASESFELYHALRDRGVPVSFIAIPQAHHFPSDPLHIEGYDRVTLQWVERYLSTR